MATETNVLITAGTGTEIHSVQLASGDHQQVMQEAWASAESETFWTVSLTATTSVIAADVGRTGVLVTNRSTGRVYLRFDATAPTAATNGSHWFLEPDDRFEAPPHLRKLAWSIIGTIANGHVVFHLGTAA